MTNCKCWKKLIDKLVEECSKNIDGNEMIYNETLNGDGRLFNSCTIYIVLLVIFFVITIGINSAFIYFYWYSKRVNTNTFTNAYANTETAIY